MNTVSDAALGTLDWSVILIYTLAVLGLGAWSKLRTRQNTAEFLVAGHSMHWMVVALAVFATLFSTISFVSCPGEAYNYGLLIMIVSLGQIVFLPAAIWLFLRFFFNAPTFTAYEYLERRFDRKCRMLGALLFLTIRLFYTGGVFYAAAVIFEAMVGWPPALTILLVGGVTMIYSYLGGIRAVIWADVIQSIIIFIGIAAILIRLLDVTGFEVGAVFQFAHLHDHTFERLADPAFYRLNVHDRWNFWLLIIAALFAPMTTLSCDQMVIQRLLAGKNYRQAVRAVYTNYALSVPVISMLFGIGLFLFYYYNGGGGVLPPGTPGDQVLGYFINTMLPSPLPGLIVTALLAALMSTIAGAVNSLVAVVLKDVIVPLHPALADTPRELQFCRILTFVVALSSMGVALLMHQLGQGVRTTVQEVIGVWATLWPILFSAFFYGVISRRVSAKAIFVSLLVSGTAGLAFPYFMYYAVGGEARWGYFWVGFPGQLLAMILPPLLAFFWPDNRPLVNLTLRTLNHDPEESR